VKNVRLRVGNHSVMAVRILSLMLAVTQLMSWAAAPLNLCISTSGSVSVELGDGNCTRCIETCHEQVQSEPSTCCGHCCSHESNDQPVLALIETPCDCTHIPLMIEQDDSIRASTAPNTTSWNAPVLWLHVPYQFLPRTISALVLHWDCRDNRARHPISLMTTQLRC
jgi:hypothetical protein